uniref:Si:ch73-113g13.2 n=1 Tax=Hucho hucho TaxID=62062 RepID=A0A4W5M8L6_9TELE
MQPTNISTCFNFDGNLNSNFTSNNTSRDYYVIAPCLVLGLCCLVGLPCNIAMIVDITKKLKMPHNKNRMMLKLILNLAVSDTLSLSTIPLVIYVLTYGWTLCHWMCSLFYYGLYCCLYASVLTVTLMGVYLYLSLTSNIPDWKKYERIHSEQHNKMLVGLWVLVCVIASPTIFTRAVEPKRGRLRCQRSTCSDWEKVAVLLMETILGFFIPFSILATSYFCLHRKVSKQINKSEPLVTCILVTFFIFWTPVNIINVVDIATTLIKTSDQGAYDNMKSFRRIAGDVVKTLTFINSCLNPFLYAFASKQNQDTESKQSIIKKGNQSQTNSTNATSDLRSSSTHQISVSTAVASCGANTVTTCTSFCSSLVLLTVAPSV